MRLAAQSGTPSPQNRSDNESCSSSSSSDPGLPGQREAQGMKQLRLAPT